MTGQQSVGLPTDFGGGGQASIPGAGVQVAQTAAVAEIQSRLTVAMHRPRSPSKAMELILDECRHPLVAEHSAYSYKRGGEDVTGATIRLVEVVARHWGNLEYGFHEIAVEGSRTHVEAYCIDLQTNNKAVQRFWVEHWRDTQRGGYQLEAQRDIYELVANQGSRRLRSVITRVVPTYLIDRALAACERTLAGDSDKPMADRITDMLAAFEGLGVTKPMLERRVNGDIDAISVRQLHQLSKVFNGIRGGDTTVDREFPPAEGEEPVTADDVLDQAASQKPPTLDSDSDEGRAAEQPSEGSQASVETEAGADPASDNDGPDPTAEDMREWVQDRSLGDPERGDG